MLSLSWHLLMAFLVLRGDNELQTSNYYHLSYIDCNFLWMKFKKVSFNVFCYVVLQNIFQNKTTQVIKLFPLNFSARCLHCYVCTSDKLADCATLHSIDELPTQLCPSDIAQCFTKVERRLLITCLFFHIDIIPIFIWLIPFYWFYQWDHLLIIRTWVCLIACLF